LKPPSRRFRRTTWFPRLKSCIHMLLHFALKQMLLHSLTNGTQLYLCRNGLRCTNKSRAGSWLRAASPAAATTSASTDRRRQRPPLHQQRQQPPLRAVRQQQRPPQGERRCERSSPPSSYRGDNEAIKAKESGGPDGPGSGGNHLCKGSLTSGSHHLSTDDHGHLRTRGPRSHPPTE
jgi:hypothetical protein